MPKVSKGQSARNLFLRRTSCCFSYLVVTEALVSLFIQILTSWAGAEEASRCVDTEVSTAPIIILALINVFHLEQDGEHQQ